MNRQVNSGFTLIELMITVAILGIIVMLAYPSYQQYLIDARRTDAQQALLGFANAIERFKVENMTYQGAAAGGASAGVPSATVFPSQAPVDGGTAYYNLSIISSTSRNYTLRAMPINGTSQQDDGLIEFLSTGVKRRDKNDDGDATDSGENNWDK